MTNFALITITSVDPDYGPGPFPNVMWSVRVVVVDSGQNQLLSGGVYQTVSIDIATPIHLVTKAIRSAVAAGVFSDISVVVAPDDMFIIGLIVD